MGAASLLFFVLIFYNRVTRIASAAVVVLAAVIVLLTLERWESQANHFYDVILMIRGYLYYRPELGTTILWAVSLLFGLVVAVFMLYRFSFYLLALTGIAIFLFTWGPGFTRDSVSFLIFLVCFCLLLIRKTNRGLASVYVAAPICAALVWFIYGSVPVEADLFQRRTLQELFDGPLAAVGDLIHMMTNPMFFSFQSTGFAGHGGRLGGPVTPNNRNVMSVLAPGRTYLAGATHNTFTGYSWVTTLEPGQLYTQDMHPGQFEMLETAAALIRHASHNSDRSTMAQSMLWSIFPVEDHRYLSLRHFQALGVGGPGVRALSGEPTAIMGAGTLGGPVPERFLAAESFVSWYLHTYIPMDQVTINIGTNRTGTIFRPPNTRDIEFHPSGTNYLPNLLFEPTGNMRAPAFMSRGTQYTMDFLNVDNQLSFIGNILNASFEGIHTNPPEQIFYVPLTEETRVLARHFYDEYQGQNPEDYACNFTYVTFKFYIDEDYEFEDDPSEFTHGFSVRIPMVYVYGAQPGTQPYDVTVTAQDIYEIFGMFASPGPNRNVQYMQSHGQLMAKLDFFSRDVLSVYAQTVREHFMYVPETVPQRVHDLVADIVYGLETDYERVMAIRDYLIQFPYTLTPQPVPHGVCFVDHFLFVGQEGYCTYYASAMAIMSRIAGVPSRYVEGFLLPPAPPEAEDNMAIFVVTNMMAHAWVEVYLEGFGWLIVEATAPYAFFMDPGLTIAVPPGGFPPGTFGTDWWYWDEYYFDMMYGTDHISSTFNGLPPGGPGGVGQGGPEGPAQNMITMARVRNIVLAIAATMAAAVLAYLAVQQIRISTVVRRTRRMPLNRQIITYFGAILAIASHCASAKDPAETPYEYGQRVGMRYAFKNDSARLRDLVGVYYRARYGNHELSAAEREVMEESYFDMVNYLRVENRKSRFFYMRYILRVGAI